MKIVYVLVIGSILLFVTTIGWYISQPIVLGMTRAVNATVYSDPNARNIVTGVEYASFAWGPVFSIFIILWMVLSAIRRDAESVMYG